MHEHVYPTYTVDGIGMDGPGWYLAPETRRRPMPAARAVSVKVPGRSGDLPIVGLDLEPTAFALDLHVLPVRPDGAEGGFEALEHNLEALAAAFGVRHRLLDVRYHAAPGIVRRAEATALAASEPMVDVGNAVARLQVLLTVPGAIWRDVATATWTGALPSAAQAVTPLAGSTAPVTDAVLRITGPAVNPQVGDVVSGGTLAWDGVLAAGERLLLDCAALHAAKVAGDTWDLAAGTDVTGGVSSAGPGSASRWLHLTPAISGGDPHSRSVTVTSSATGTTGASGLQIRARRAYL
ncbi:hypothetical protein SAMN05421505_16114 [Sinosporangium album]|uniref:Uncharacterized protein n=1 Tax=Sinosporangium album TaxID=504805 RepID=A0A1G8L4U7_9ACTN|nr:hypothetical protein [Sinosporangium album]SDI50655.1 hypothetical protein SAMN05421505_16114 [Sinosporangium album]